MKLLPKILALTVALVVASFAASAFADIQDPPANDYGPTRKLGRGLANIAFCWTEIPQTITKLNLKESNASAASYGVVKGVGRAFFRFGMGWYEVTTFPIRTYRHSYRTPYRSNIPWVNSGYQEFPPELGWETRLNYSTDTQN